MKSKTSKEKGEEALCKELAKELAKDGAGEDIEKRKTELSKKHGLGSIPKNAKIISVLKGLRLSKDKKNKVTSMLRTKPTRTDSGVANIAIMWSGECDGSCIYCPHVNGIPKSYTGREPATMRAQRNEFDPERQINNRIAQLRAIGHNTDKCELIIMGGNFLIAPKNERDKFVRACVKAFEENNSNIVGLTFETRPDSCNDDNVKWMLDVGCTRVELGCQSTDDEVLEKVHRGHNNDVTKAAIKRLKNAGLKVCLHWMPGLTGVLGKVDIEKEIADFSKLFLPDYSPDELKIYPTLVIPGTKLYEMWRKDLIDVITTEQTIDLLMKLKMMVPEYIRIKRIMRDIPEQIVEQGPSTTNLRQLVQEKMASNGTKCQCIRCREIQDDKVDDSKVKMYKIEYTASGGKEIFLQFITSERRIIGFLRLRLADGEIAMVRELHVYGPMAPIGEHDDETHQHKNYGRRLLVEAENLAKHAGYLSMQITSGIGVRDYYKKFGYTLKGNYMVKEL